MIICGIDLSSNNACLVLLSGQFEDYSVRSVKPEKITLRDDESAESIKQFSREIRQFLDENNCELVVIRKRKKTGKFSGGAVSFKMEALIQMSTIAVELIDAAAVNAIARRHKADLPLTLKKYQENAFFTALAKLKDFSGS